MAGIYIHIPFCKSRCNYCDFFSSTNIKEKTHYVNLLSKELTQRKNYLSNQPIETLYWGGGTPSLLTAQELEKLFIQLEKDYGSLRKNIEITLEANPDDLSNEFLSSIGHLPFNRISIGIQSFHDTELRFLNRRHDAQSAIQAVLNCRHQGFNNISIDLMYGLPGQNLKSWEASIRQAVDLPIQHLSAYHLIYEEGTRLHTLLDAGKVNPVKEGMSVRMFEMLIQLVENAGFEQYEISNFAKPGFHSQHNSSYWDGTHYLGIGAAAHSYNGKSRQWNKNVIENYLDYAPEIEFIDSKTAYNDFIITRLRTMQGIAIEELKTSFGEEKKQYLLFQAHQPIHNGLLEIQNGYLRLTRRGIFVSDGLMSDLME